ncbi:DUF4373 domain-containing protein [Paenibacillus sp. 3LSP]|uniref:Lin1244/Lin1753 domain-containing protein n=1 Tax=Bacilli TaxID=91061 RepID=UPI0028FD82B7|nr:MULTISPECIES: Lin1244/Lin1753 domain-containing protein [Bacilli]MDU0318989.1 DUF4373 domain-containing protein [Enterococcus sp. 2STP]MDU0328925.1 DUF4373 domain-containing protein [Paenibacillus sp. 3LSP]MDU0334499.1 DUF4373 domain-containing protein [Enterococcus sp. 2CBP]MDU0350248.1 DUF4373 domain-containing protein [Enterococcus sp. 3MOLP]
MARPTKDGLDYFPLDVDIFEDEKIEAIAGEFGIKGELAVIKLLCAVYKKGYFIVWNDLTKATLLKRLPGVSKELLDQIVARLVAWEFFNEDLFNSAKVLTSENIQAVYFEATKRRKSPKPTQYVINVNINSSSNGDNVNINPQSKVKESKENKSKENTTESEQYSLQIYSYLEKNGFGSPYGNTMGDNINFWLKDLEEAGLTIEQADAWMIHGVNTAIENNNRRWKYLEGILKNRFNKRLFSKAAIEGEEEKRKNQQAKSSNSKYQNNVRREKLPDWVDKQQEENALDPNKKAEIDRRFEEYLKRKKESTSAQGNSTSNYI